MKIEIEIEVDTTTTNGEVLKALFPDEGDFETDFDEKWWNAPYINDSFIERELKNGQNFF